MAFLNTNGGEYVDRLKTSGCMRIRVTDRKHLPAEKAKANEAADMLGRKAYSSYRYPYLYVRLGEPAARTVAPKLDVSTHLSQISSESEPLRRETVSKEWI